MKSRLKPGCPGMLLLLIFLSAAPGWGFDDPPRVVVPAPSARQVAWQEECLGLFVHFGMNTFTGSESGTGDEDPKQFAPTALDCRQWVNVARAAGARTIILTAKSSDGFCLWPTATTERSVKNSGWKGGRGDVLRELADACQEGGIKLGVAVTPADSSQPAFKSNKPEYYQLYHRQLEEVLTQYGPVHEVWFDGKGSEEKDFGDWSNVIGLVRKLQPEAIIKQGPARKVMRTGCEDAQWVGNFMAIAPTTSWSIFPRPNIDYKYPVDIAHPIWLPYEGRVTLAKNFWSNEELKTPAQLLDRYYKSVGRNSNLLICVAPDTSGRITKEASDCLAEFGAALKQIFGKDLAAGKPVTASNVRQGSAVFAPEMALDKDASTYWATDDGVTNASIEVKLLGTKEFNVVRLEEMVSLGQRVQGYTVEAYDAEGAKWVQVAQGTTIGFRKLDRFPTVKASRVRLTITQALACLAIKSLGVHLDSASDPADFEPANALAEAPASAMPGATSSGKKPASAPANK